MSGHKLKQATIPYIPEQPCHKVEPAAVRVAKDVLLDTICKWMLMPIMCSRE